MELLSPYIICLPLSLGEFWITKDDDDDVCVWEGGGRGLGEKGYMYTYGWVPSLFTWNLQEQNERTKHMIK